MQAVSVALATTGVLGLLMVVLLASMLSSGVAGITEWFAANGALALALPLLLARGRIPDFLSIVVANGLVALAGVLLYAGFARFLKRPLGWPAGVASVALVTLAMAYWRYAVDSIPARVVISTFFTAGVCIAVACVVIRHRPKGQASYTYWATSVSATIFAIAQLARGLYFATLPGTSSPTIFDTSVNVILLCVGAAILPVLSMCALSMVHNTLLIDARKAVNHDFLTGALSRKRFQALTLDCLDRADQTNLPVSLLILDIDHFKSINDTLGHTGGDSVLREFSALMQRNLRPNDSFGRLGGEEFGVLLPDTPLADAKAIADRLCNEASQHHVSTEAGPCRYSMSGGLALRLRGETFDEMAMRADRALYEAKLTGRNKICVAGSVHTMVLELESESGNPA